MGHDFPTTDDYKIGVDVDLNLGKRFWEESDGCSIGGRLELVAKALTGRTDLTVFVRQRLSLSEEYNPKSDMLFLYYVPDLEESLCFYLGVSPDNTPDNIPDDLTFEYLAFLRLMHESGHVVRYSSQAGTEYPVSSIVVGEGVCAYSVPTQIVEEVDAELAPLEYLRREGQSDIEQFYIDMRVIESLTKKFLASKPDIYSHDSSVLLDYYRREGELLDPKVYLEEKQFLIQKLREEIGVDEDWFPLLVQEQRLQARFQPLNSEVEDWSITMPRITPQKIRYALENLLDRGELEGMQKHEAELFVAATERMGYQPDSDPAFMQKFEERMVDSLKVLFGLSDGYSRHQHCEF